MKVISLQFLNKVPFVGEQGKASHETHDIRPFGAGFWLVHHRASNKSYLVHASLAIAQVDMSEDDEPAAADAASRPVPGRGKAAQGKAPVPTG